MNYLQKKKLAFMSIVNQIKGFIRTVSGIFPLTLPNCVDDKSITDYKLYGQSVQDGTPTPDNPVEVESVGERTKNLFNPSKLTGGSFVEYNGVQCYNYMDVSPTSDINFKYVDEFKENTQYTIAIRVIISGESQYTGIAFNYTDGTRNLLYITNSDSVFMLTTEANKTLQNIEGRHFSGVNCYIDLSVTQLIEGTVVEEYEPYGYKIPITVSGKNLFNINTYGEILDSYNFVAAFNISKLDVGTVITLSTKDEYYYKISNSAGSSSKYLYQAKKYTFVLTQEQIDLGYLYIISSKTWKPETKENLLSQNVQIEYGSTATDYEPYKEPISTVMYLDEPLYKVGDYADYIDFENGKVVRQVGKYIFTGSESNMGGAEADADCFGYSLKLNGLSLTSYKTGLCNRLKIFHSVGSNGVSRIAFHPTKNHPYCYVFFAKSDFPDLEEYNPTTAKQIVKQMYDSGDLLILYYNVNTPTETPITLPNIPTLKGTSIITVDTTIQPSNAEVTYYSTLKE